MTGADSRSDSGGSSGSTGLGIISNPNTRTMHYGDRENGASCGTQAKSFAELDAENPLHAVEKYAAKPCTRCFEHVSRLNTVFLNRHSATVCYQDVEEVIDRLPWSLPTGADQSDTAPEPEQNGGEE